MLESLFIKGKSVVYVDPEGLQSDIFEIKAIYADIYLLENKNNEITATIDEIQPIEDTVVCKHCGNIDIVKLAWVKANGPDECVDIKNSVKQYYCNFCDKIVIGDPISLKDYKE